MIKLPTLDNTRVSQDADRNGHMKRKIAMPLPVEKGSRHADGQCELKECEFGRVSTQLWCDRVSRWSCSFAVCFVSGIRSKTFPLF